MPFLKGVSSVGTKWVAGKAVLTNRDWSRKGRGRDLPSVPWCSCSVGLIPAVFFLCCLCFIIFCKDFFEFVLVYYNFHMERIQETLPKQEMKCGVKPVSEGRSLAVEIQTALSLQEQPSGGIQLDP